jgi:peptidoglycan hydrolase-like protein with peptidoglycan-binding domain
LTQPGHLRRNRGWYAAAGAIAGLLAVILIGALVLGSTRASLSADATALARIGVPLGGGKVERVSVVTGPRSEAIPVQVRAERIWPSRLVGAHQLVSIDVVVKRAGWISWLVGGTQHLRLTLTTPSSSLREHYLTLRSGAPVLLSFKQPVRVIAYGPPGRLVRHVFATPRSQIALDRSTDAGTIAVAAAPRSWETSAPALVSWFPAGATAAAVADPTPGTAILPRTKITLTFSKTVADALGSARPPVSPATAGSWHTTSSHTIVFEPEGYGYGLGAKVAVGLPRGIRLVGAQPADAGTWTVPAGSTRRLQQLLAQLGYLPLSFNPAGSDVASTPEAQEAAAIHPPTGSFSWRYPNIPASLRSFWSPGASGVMTRGALMAFQNDHGLAADGVPGATVWRSLINAALSGRRSSAGYTYVMVSTGSQSLNLWHNGRTILTTPVNTGIASQPTATGTYPVFEHIASGTMSGTNPDGSHYNDPGIQFISYFNGGDALHAFTRAQYGSPQSLGCVEMALGPAGQVWPYTPIGTLVHVE